MAAVPGGGAPRDGNRLLSRRQLLIALTGVVAAVPAYLAGAYLGPRSTGAAPVAPSPSPTPTATPSPAPQVHTAPVPVAGAPGLRSMKRLPPNRLIIPRIDLDALVVPLGVRYDQRGALVWETAAHAVGHYVNTDNPGENGNCVLSGHISSAGEGDVFRRLPELEPGDGVTVGTQETLFLYRIVDRQVVLPTATTVMDPGEGSKLTLLTCVPDGVYSHRLVLTAIPV